MAYPELTVIDDIRKSILKHKDKVACVFDDQILLYSDLSLMSAKAMTKMRDLGVEKGKRVFVCLDNCIEVPVVYLAIMELGAIFIPVNPQWHSDRISSLVSNIQPDLVLVNSGFYQGSVNHPVARIDELFEAASSLSETTEVFPEDPLYAFFTSGSTGLPKCALNIHKGIKNRFDYMSQIFSPLLDGLVVLQNSKLSFDSSIWQMLWPLTVGGTVVLRKTSRLTDFDQILEEIHKNKVKMTDFVPTIFSEFVNYVKRDSRRVEQIQSLKSLLVGGEAIRPVDIWDIKGLVAGLDVYNTYGPTEASIGMMFRKVAPEDKEYIPIGKPIDNTYAVVVDKADQAVGPNIKGEILIGGLCVGGGYINDPKKTSESYVKNTFEGIPGDKLFRTGNIGYVDDVGVFHCVGRLDDELKIGGIRVSLSEIENELETHEHITNSKAIVYANRGSDQIACFFDAATQVDERSLKVWLSSKIPRECVPARIIQLSSFPVNDNGKVDLVGLKQYLKVEPAVGIGETEDAILSIVEKVIGQKVNDEDQPLFELGANSLDMYVICRNIEEGLGKGIPVKDLFNGFTVANIRRLCSVSVAIQSTKMESGLKDLLRRDIANRKRTRDQGGIPDGGKRNMFIAGATGYLGLHLLQQLAGSSKGIIYCLVRRQNFLDPEAFKQEFERYNLGFTDRLISRIKPILGDIEQPLFGLSKAEFDGLGESLAQIFFIAGKVNLIADYTILRKSNVQALENAFRLSEVNGCRLSYVSSNTINDITNNYSCEQIVDNGIAASVSGYDLTKVISEKMLFDHLIDGNKVSVIRVGDVVPENVSSPLNKNSILAYLMELMNSVGAVPDVDITMDIISAAELSRRLVYCKEPFLCLTKPESFTRFFSERCSDCSIVSIETFVDRVTNVNNLNRGAEFVRGILCSSKNIPLDEVIYKNFIRPFTPVDEKGLALNYIAGLFSSPETYKEDLVAIS